MRHWVSTIASNYPMRHWVPFWCVRLDPCIRQSLSFVNRVINEMINRTNWLNELLKWNEKLNCELKCEMRLRNEPKVYDMFKFNLWICDIVWWIAIVEILNLDCICNLCIMCIIVIIWIMVIPLSMNYSAYGCFRAQVDRSQRSRFSIQINPDFNKTWWCILPLVKVACT